ncbi:MAG: hypothetical protein EHM59_04180, partial [Betaproteobacteria bacterium]
MRTSVALLCSVLAIVQLAGIPAARAIGLGQVDTFESGTTLGWQVGSGGHPAPPTLATGGPAGSTDHFLQLEALGGDGPGSRLAVFNAAQWAGDYSAAGVTRIEMDVFNFGPSDLSLRLLFLDFEAMNPVNMALSADAMFVPAGSGWIRISFPTAAAALFAQSGSAAAALANADELRLFHNPAMAYP